MKVKELLDLLEKHNDNKPLLTIYVNGYEKDLESVPIQDFTIDKLTVHIENHHTCEITIYV